MFVCCIVLNTIIYGFLSVCTAGPITTTVTTDSPTITSISAEDTSSTDPGKRGTGVYVAQFDTNTYMYLSKHLIQVVEPNVSVCEQKINLYYL